MLPVATVMNQGDQVGSSKFLFITLAEHLPGIEAFIPGIKGDFAPQIH